MNSSVMLNWILESRGVFVKSWRKNYKVVQSFLQKDYCITKKAAFLQNGAGKLLQSRSIVIAK